MLTADSLLITEAKLTADSLITIGLTLCGQGADSEKKNQRNNIDAHISKIGYLMSTSTKK